jgi:hypothetical protein
MEWRPREILFSSSRKLFCFFFVLSQIHCFTLFFSLLIRFESTINVGEDNFAQELQAELPDQILQYFDRRGIVPVVEEE